MIGMVATPQAEHKLSLKGLAGRHYQWMEQQKEVLAVLYQGVGVLRCELYQEGKHLC